MHVLTKGLQKVCFNFISLKHIQGHQRTLYHCAFLNQTIQNILTFTSPPVLVDVMKIGGNTPLFPTGLCGFEYLLLPQILTSVHPIQNALNCIFVQYFADVKLPCFSKKVFHIRCVVLQNICNHLQKKTVKLPFDKIQNPLDIYSQHIPAVEWGHKYTECNII